VVTAPSYPSVYIYPGWLANETAQFGNTTTFSIMTDYIGDDIVSYQFNLAFNPNVLAGGYNKTDTWMGNPPRTSFIATSGNVAPGSEKVYVNGTLTPPNELKTDTWTGDGSTTVFYTTKTPIIEDSEEVRVDGNLKRRAGSATDHWIASGGQTVFVTTETPVVEATERVFVNDTLQVRGVDYTIVNATGTITFYSAPDDGDWAWVDVDYDYGHYNMVYTNICLIEFLTAPGATLGIEASYRFIHYTLDYVGVTAPRTRLIFPTAPDTGTQIKLNYFWGGVVNGDLVAGGSAYFKAGAFDNTAGYLSLSSSFFSDELDNATGPGILANVTFTVVGNFVSDITLETGTELIGWNPTPPPGSSYDIVNAETMPNNIGHGYFKNTFISDIRGPPTASNPPDGLVDGWDYNFIGLYYGKTSLDPEWSICSICDIRGPGLGNLPDGVIDGWDYNYAGLQYGSSLW